MSTIYRGVEADAAVFRDRDRDRDCDSELYEWAFPYVFGDATNGLSPTERYLAESSLPALTHSAKLDEGVTR
jgi:hypothetical protein